MFFAWTAAGKPVENYDYSGGAGAPAAPTPADSGRRRRHEQPGGWFRHRKVGGGERRRYAELPSQVRDLRENREVCGVVIEVGCGSTSRGRLRPVLK